MTENNDKLIHRFMNDRKKEIEDHGFSRRVMKQLPDREKRISNLWVVCCSIAGMILFFLLGGAKVVAGIVRIITSGSANYFENTDPLPLTIAIAVLLCLGVKRICSIE